MMMEGCPAPTWCLVSKWEAGQRNTGFDKVDTFLGTDNSQIEEGSWFIPGREDETMTIPDTSKALTTTLFTRFI